MRHALPWLAASLLAWTAGCASSPPTRFYTLEPVQSQHGMTAMYRGPIQVAAVHIPPLLDRDQMVREGGRNELVVSDGNRWGAPLAQMLRSVLTQDLLLRLPASAVVLPQQPAPAQTSVITVDVLRFQAEPSGSVVLEGAWSLVPPGSETASLNLGVHISEPANAQDYAAQAQAMSSALGRLADDIAGLLSRQP